MEDLETAALAFRLSTERNMRRLKEFCESSEGGKYALMNLKELSDAQEVLLRAIETQPVRKKSFTDRLLHR